MADISEFELTAAEVAIHEGFQHVVCGHIHQPQLRTISNAHGSVRYMNSGDWIEHMSALEYADGQWRIHYHHAQPVKRKAPKPVPVETAMAELSVA